MPSSAYAAADIRPRVDALIAQAVAQRASDVHIEPDTDGYEIRFRIDGLLQLVEKVSRPTGHSIINRLMVMARLLTYRSDIPQEGRVSIDVPHAMDLRLSVIPTVHGLRAVIRMPADLIAPHRLEDLNLPKRCYQFLKEFCAADSGMLIITGPAGSGKTTTIYALLQHLAESRRGESIISLEDPIERTIRGVTQIEVSTSGAMNYQTALRSVLRQDPQTLAIGEIRDGATASLAVQAALTGHRLLSTLHAGSPVGAIRRLLEMGVERYQLDHSIFGFLNQRLVRRKTPNGYCGRLPIAESLRIGGELTSTVLLGHDKAEDGNAQSLTSAARALVAAGHTDEAEVCRVLGRKE
jgi:type II secretory ATPase GspE/PulE/Tfp pilus assembly ATPase PilB-like protein